MAARADGALNVLTPAEVRQFRELGYLVGLPAIPGDQAGRACARFAAIDRARLDSLPCPWFAQAQYLFTWVDEIVRAPAILDAVEDLLGPDLLVEDADLFVKEPRSGSYISFHQDSYYWDIEPHEIVTAWVALSEATIENGCMRYAARTHLADKRPHEETFAHDNALSRGQVMALPEGTDIVDVALAPGEMAIHHCFLGHASGPNRTDRLRLGLAIRYFPAHVRQVSGPRMHAAVVRGRDRYGNFGAPLPRPQADLDTGAIAAHQAALSPHAPSNFATA